MWLCWYDMMPWQYVWTVDITVFLWHDAVPLIMNSTCDCELWHDALSLFMNNTCDCVGMTRHTGIINEHYRWLFSYDMMSCHYLWTVHVTVFLWHDTLPLFMYSTCDCVDLSRHTATIVKSTCECVAMTLHIVTLYEQYLWLCCYDIMHCHYLWTVLVTVFAITWHTATIYEHYMWLCCYDMTHCHYLRMVQMTVLLWRDTLPLFMNSKFDCVAMTWCPDYIYELYMWLCYYDMMPSHY